MMQPNRNINRNLKTTKTDNSCTQKKNLPPGKNKYNTQSSDNNSKQVIVPITTISLPQIH